MICLKKSDFFRFLYTIVFLSNFLIAQNSKSPYSLSTSMDLGIAAVSGSLLLGSVIVDYSPMSIEKISTLDSDIIPGYDSKAIQNWNLKSAKKSDVLLFSSIVLPSVLLLDKKVRRDYYKFSILWAESIFLTLGITNLTKVLVKRPRPYLYESKAPDEYKKKSDNRKSFFSGHTSISTVSWFLFARMYNDYNPDSKFSPYVTAAALVFPGLTAYYRYDAGKHFPSDLVAGYLVGGAIGFFIPEWHRKNNKVDISFRQKINGNINVQLFYKF